MDTDHPLRMLSGIFAANFTVSSTTVGANLFSHGILLGPFPSSLRIQRVVGLEDVGDLRDQRIVWVWIGQQRADRKENFRNGEGWGPLILEDIETDGTITVDVRVIEPSCEVDLVQMGHSQIRCSNNETHRNDE